MEVVVVVVVVVHSMALYTYIEMASLFVIGRGTVGLIIMCVFVTRLIYRYIYTHEEVRQK
jgi:hypothetical protein